MRLRTTGLVITSFVFLSGCGGGGALVESGPGPDQQVGPMSVQGDARALAPTQTAGGSTLYAVSGSINKVNFVDANPIVAETELVFAAAKGAGFSIMACSPDGGGLRVILDNVGIIARLEVIGEWVYYVDPNSNLRRVKLSGGASQLVRTGVTRFASNLAGTKIYGYQIPSANWAGGRFISFNPDGTSVTHMFAAPFVMGSTDFFPGLTSDGSLVLVDNQHTSFTSYRVYSPAGSLRQGGLDHTNMIEGVGMESGTDFVYHKTSGYTERLSASGTAQWNRELVTGVRYDYDVAIAPGGTKIAFANGVTDNLSGILVDTLPVGDLKRVFHSDALVVSWGPFVKSRTFVGSGAPFASAGAFIFSERGPVLPAVVWADATTRGSIVLTKVSPDGAQNVVYRLDCDDLTKLSYTKSLNYDPVHVVTAGSGLKGAFLSFNGESGVVESISTFTRSPSIAVEGATLKVSGVDAVYSAGGKVESHHVVEFK